MKDEERLQISELEHKNFVDCMWKDFGLSSHPGYSLIEIKPLLFASGGVVSFNPPHFYLSDLLFNSRDIIYATCHETSHILYGLSTGFCKGNQNSSNGENLILEVLCEFGTMNYLSIIGKNPIKESEHHYEKNPIYSNLLARDLLKSKLSLRDISDKPLREVIDRVRPHLKRELDLSKYPDS